MMGSSRKGREGRVISTAGAAGGDAARPSDPGHRVIEGRRWRISDPAVPEPLRQALVNELMAARRGVAAGNRLDDEAAVKRARARVQDAKVALGERGPRWWLERDDADHRVRTIAATRALLRGVGNGGTGSSSSGRAPSLSAIARIVDGDRWRRRLPLVRRTLFELDAAREIEIRQRGRRVDASAAGRLSLVRGPRFPAPP